MPKFLSALFETLFRPIASRTRSKTGSPIHKTTPVQYPTRWFHGRGRDESDTPEKRHKRVSTREFNGRSEKLAMPKHTPDRRAMRKGSSSRNRRGKSRSKYPKKRLKTTLVELVRYSKKRGKARGQPVSMGGSKRHRRTRRQKPVVRKARPANTRKKRGHPGTRRRLRPKSGRQTSLIRSRRPLRSRNRGNRRKAASRRYRKRFSSGEWERQRSQIVTKSLSQEVQNILEDPPKEPRRTTEKCNDVIENDPLNVHKLCRSLVSRFEEAPADPRHADQKRNNTMRRGVGNRKVTRNAQKVLREKIGRYGKRQRAAPRRPRRTSLRSRRTYFKKRRL